MYNMSVGDMLKKKLELMAQYNTIGVPTDSELQSSENVVYVHEYTRDDGTVVRAHWRSKRDGVENAVSNSASDTIKISNEKSTGIATGGASDINNNTSSQHMTDEELNKKLYSDEKTTQETIYEKLLINPTELNLYKKYKQNDIQQTQKFIKPAEGPITSDYGYRIQPTKGASKFHSGIDIGVPMNTPILAVQDGVVTSAGYTNMGGYGMGVFIEHSHNGEKIKSEYGHLSKWCVKEGEKVKKGQVIGYSGNSGISTGPHLHVSIKKYNSKKNQWESVNPRKYIEYK